MEGVSGPIKDTAYRTRGKSFSGSDGQRLLQLVKAIVDSGDDRLIAMVTMEVEKCLNQKKE